MGKAKGYERKNILFFYFIFYPFRDKPHRYSRTSISSIFF